MPDDEDYATNLRKLKSVLIYEALQRREDQKAFSYIKNFSGELDWALDLSINDEAWQKIKSKDIDPKYVFCHPNILLYKPTTSIYYRGLCNLSLKSVKDYFGAAENLELGNKRAHLSQEKALKMAQTYNEFISFIVKNIDDWSLDAGSRSIVATLGISLDGTNRNKVGDLAEKRLQGRFISWLSNKNLIDAKISDSEYQLRNHVLMKFAPEPDISFIHEGSLLSVIEIKGGIDPAGALERYGAAKKSFNAAIDKNSHCDTYYISAVITDTLRERVENDRLVNHLYDMVDILSDGNKEEEFFLELFHHSLRII